MKRKPGRGWEHLGGAVWERTVTRIHVGHAMCRMGGEWVPGEIWPVSFDVRRHIAEQGGNRRRGIMVWALTLGGTP